MLNLLDWKQVNTYNKKGNYAITDVCWSLVDFYSHILDAFILQDLDNEFLIPKTEN